MKTTKQVLSWKKINTGLNAELGPHYKATNSGELSIRISIPFTVLNPNRLSYSTWDKLWSVVIFNEATRNVVFNPGCDGVHGKADFHTLEEAQQFCEAFIATSGAAADQYKLVEA